MVLGIVFAVFLLVIVTVFAVAATMSDRTARARLIRSRLQSVERAASRKPSEELALLRDELLSEIPALNRLLSRSSRITRLQGYLSQADMKMRAGKFVLISTCTSFMAGLLVFAFTRVTMFALLAAGFGAVIPYAYVSWRRSRRFHAFETKFPEAIDLLARATRAGHTFGTALELIGSELSEPIAGEFRKLFEEQNFGMPIKDALLNLAERMPLIDVKFFATTIMLQRETGGNLAEILDKLSYVIRERFKILRQLRVYTAQGRLTMAILMALPPGLLLMLLFINRPFLQPLFHDPIGHMFIGIAVIMQTIGFFLIRKIIHIKV
jgi:tight adherence protein B